MGYKEALEWVEKSRQEDVSITMRAYKMIDLCKDIPCPTGWFTKRCPYCNEKVESKRYKGTASSPYFYYFGCGNCEYEYFESRASKGDRWESTIGCGSDDGMG